MEEALYIALCSPLIGFVLLVALAHLASRRQVGVVACTTIGISFLSFLVIFTQFLLNGLLPQDFTLYNWISVKGISVDFSLHIDALALLMALIISGVGFLIHLYSIGYMDHEKDFARYFAFLNFFIFSMLLLVLAGNLLLLFAGWESVGLASYLLIGFWYHRPAAAQAATKAFVMNRIGDLGLLLGILLTFTLFGTADIEKISQQATKFAVGAPAITLLTVLYFIGATGKSAQIPLHSWLPDAMEGPTPVSALIHAATMVTAGVYLVVRMHAIFLLAPMTLQLMGVVGAATSLFAALCASSQTDLKKVLAYSTVSQLGLMFLACGAGAFYSAMFHLTTHAFIKALLFLSAGNVVHMLHGETEMGQMGGLSKIFTKTHWLFLVGVLALSGIPPFAGFFSKDLILEQEYLTGHNILFYISLTASILTGFYLIRAYCLTFMGKLSEEDPKTTEAPAIMLTPVFILAILSLCGGLLGFTFGSSPLLEYFLKDVGLTPIEIKLHSGYVMTLETLVAVIGAFVGVGLSAWAYTRLLSHLSAPFPLFKRAFYVDEIYQKLIVSPLRAIATFIADFFEPKIFDRAIGMTTQSTQAMARWMQHIQSGQLRSYIAWMVLGSALLMGYFVF